VVYRVETDNKNSVQAFHCYDPNKTSTRITGKTFVLACNGIETPKILLLSKNERNPQGIANSSDQVGRNMMDTPKIFVLLQFKDPVWGGLGPVQTGAIMSTSQGDFRSRHAGGQISLINFSTASMAGLGALKQKLVGKALDQAIRRETACNGVIAVEHEVLPHPENRLTLSDKKDVLGLNKPAVYYDVGDYVRQGADQHTFPITRKFADALGAAKVTRAPGFKSSEHIMGGTIMGKDAKVSVVDTNCRAHDHPNLFLPGGAAMPSAGSGNSTLTMAALAVKAADAITQQMRSG
jgi:fructose 5-dehydrogenase large subunit